MIRRTFKPIFKMNTEEFEQFVGIFKESFDFEFQNKIDQYKDLKKEEEKEEEPDFNWDDYPYWDEVKFLGI
jgi:hypothetical protein